MIMLPGERFGSDTPVFRHADSGPAADEAPGLLASTGIAPLDERVGGLVRGRHYLLDGAPGSGKSCAAIQFIGAGLAAGETCVILTQDDPADLLAQGEYLGFDLRSAAEADRLIVVRFRLDFSRSYARAADPATRRMASHRKGPRARRRRFIRQC
jgi:KaiC/GvpD/RAD55 family RecA-like ATPase